jgi:hypothetical protein
MKRILLFSFLALASYASAAECMISAMTIQDKIWYKCTALETGKRYILSWSIDNLSDATDKAERIIEKISGKTIKPSQMAESALAEDSLSLFVRVH